MCKTLKLCDCPPDWDDPPAKNVRRTPLDKLGFTWKCCRCIPLRTACILICIITFFWAFTELAGTEKYMKRLFDGDVLYYAKLTYTLIAFGLIIAASLLMLGIIMANYQLLNIYVWYAFVFTCIYLSFYMICTLYGVVLKGEMTGKQSIKVVAAVLWCFLYFYFIIVVNSYKIVIW